jgi:hypothetical protein
MSMVFDNRQASTLREYLSRNQGIQRGFQKETAGNRKRIREGISEIAGG